MEIKTFIDRVRRSATIVRRLSRPLRSFNLPMWVYWAYVFLAGVFVLLSQIVFSIEFPF